MLWLQHNTREFEDDDEDENDFVNGTLDAETGRLTGTVSSSFTLRLAGLR
jgi:hypothetical protein